ncbi:hypothetical protein E1301_Tti009289 [Triplophysa tibetana]|uniref:Uncharacterized protein n=1 Tax=Triplophysa tibetana TaxID=1572043 RepID=A0A5A9NWW7_9TELE|nr:hypothetical protein E1301_Tti009289 [Triplophysa tibetana]
MAARHSVSTLIGRCTLQLCASQVSRSLPRHSTLSWPAAFYFDTFSRGIRSGGGFAVPRPHGTAVCTQLDTKSNFTHGLLERPDPRWKECLYVCESDCEVEQIKATLDDEQVVWVASHADSGMAGSQNHRAWHPGVPQNRTVECTGNIQTADDPLGSHILSSEKTKDGIIRTICSELGPRRLFPEGSKFSSFRPLSPKMKMYDWSLTLNQHLTDTDLMPQYKGMRQRSNYETPSQLITAKSNHTRL